MIIETLSYGRGAPRPVVNSQRSDFCEWRAAHARRGSKCKTESDVMTAQGQPVLPSTQPGDALPRSPA